MGSLITLGLGNLELDWGKNSLFINHSVLFSREDIRTAPYYYFDDRTEEKISEQKPAYVRPLRNVVKRLEMLGYTTKRCKGYYDELKASWPKYYPPPALTFDQFSNVLRSVNIAGVALPEDPQYYDPGEYVVETILNGPEFTKTAKLLALLKKDEGEFFENLHPYVTLRLLAENPANLDHLLIWRFADVVENDWVEMDELYEKPSRRVLVVTEGSSDSAILREALPLVEPDVADFFDFVDMSENYPFTGTGNIYRFCQGLARIQIQNHILVVLDNDTAGTEAAQKIRQLDLPKTMLVTVLPDLEECRSMRTLGPSGENQENVNGRGVGIECFLDLQRADAAPCVRWTSFNQQTGAYQGELISKESYTRRFFAEVRKDRHYDLSKLSLLWSHLLTVCGSFADLHAA